eukprot:CAMPEP_0118932890 /NCGR_PEP_ID=MMETSP1169-20130426/10674_1 /TAXON_ID=36882 /ORGANISM="Pyramimonas obovata, Strain CCMP722" /LENGTH=34 /DNA_ID= /DNA_START= /DNA_END= /DNA_ORIENTATION=
MARRCSARLPRRTFRLNVSTFSTPASFETGSALR